MPPPFGRIKEQQTWIRPRLNRQPKTKRPLVRETPNNQPKKTPVKDRYHYDRNGNYQGRTSSEGPGGGFGLLFLLLLLPVLPGILLLGILILIGLWVFAWLTE